MNGADFADVLVLLAGGMFVLGYLIINQLVLRIMLLLGTFLYIWYYAVFDATPLWPAIWASMATGLANLIGLFSLIARNSTWAIPAAYRDIYDQFNILPPGDFRKLMLAARRVTREAGYKLTDEGGAVDTLYYIVDSEVAVEKFGERFLIPKGVFIGEVAYLTGNFASAKTSLEKDSDVLEWDVAMLKRIATRDPKFRLAMDAMISLDLAGKIARAGSPGVENALS